MRLEDTVVTEHSKIVSICKIQKNVDLNAFVGPTLNLTDILTTKNVFHWGKKELIESFCTFTSFTNKPRKNDNRKCWLVNTASQPANVNNEARGLKNKKQKQKRPGLGKTTCFRHDGDV